MINTRPEEEKIIKNVRNLFRPEKENKGIVRNIKNDFEYEE